MNGLSPLPPVEAPRVTRATWILLAICVSVLLGGELTARLAQRYSKFYRRVDSESHEALALRHGQPGTILFAGNSLLRYGLDFERMNHDLAPRIHASRFVIEGSGYYDWYYALRRLFRRGMRPDYVILCLNSGFLADRTPPDQLSAYLLFGVSDIWKLSREVHHGLTAEAGLYLGHFSALFGAGPELRSVLLARLMNQPDLFDQLYPPVPPFPNDPQFTTRVADRFRALNQLCGNNNSKFVFLIPPARERGDNEVVRAGEQAHIRMLHPIPNVALDSTNYYDEYHLNDKGEMAFTTALEPALRQLY
jgi:hypothetical protein